VNVNGVNSDILSGLSFNFINDVQYYEVGNIWLKVATYFGQRHS
jgi:hypothetical protein